MMASWSKLEQTSSCQPVFESLPHRKSCFFPTSNTFRHHSVQSVSSISFASRLTMAIPYSNQLFHPTLPPLFWPHSQPPYSLCSKLRNLHSFNYYSWARSLLHPLYGWRLGYSKGRCVTRLTGKHGTLPVSQLQIRLVSHCWGPGHEALQTASLSYHLPSLSTRRSLGEAGQQQEGLLSAMLLLPVCKQCGFSFRPRQMAPFSNFFL